MRKFTPSLVMYPMVPAAAAESVLVSEAEGVAAGAAVTTVPV